MEIYVHWLVFNIIAILYSYYNATYIFLPIPSILYHYYCCVTAYSYLPWIVVSTTVLLLHYNFDAT